MAGGLRHNARFLAWLRAVVFLAAGYAALQVLPFFPPITRVPIALLIGVLGLLAPTAGVVVLVVCLALPLTVMDFLVGALFLFVGLAAVHYFGRDSAGAFVVVSLALLASLTHMEWALAPLAGIMLGVSDGPIAAAVAVAVVEIVGIAFGKPSLGAVTTGGGKALLDLARLHTLKDPLSFAWLAPSLGRLDIPALLKSLGTVHEWVLLVLQPALWALAASVSVTIMKRKQPIRSVLGVGGITAGLAALSIGASSVLHGPVPGPLMYTTAGISVIVAVGFAAADTLVFPRRASSSAAAQMASVSGEDADVDELLRTIAAAEEQLHDRHTSDATVLITDMKSFSRITQEQGTMATAKLIQQHRDLLLPILKAAGGHGKSTGGDGLLAAFPSAEDALSAAMAMQRALKEHNATAPVEKRIEIRIGLASGEVIVDRSGCPFIGDALNLAARVMGLADGGQVLAARDVVDQATDLPAPVVSHGLFSLKNISRPVDVFELLWDKDQQPKRPMADPPAA